MIWGASALVVLGLLVAAPFVYAPGGSDKEMPPLADGLHLSQTVTRTVDVPVERLRAWLEAANVGEMIKGSSMLPSVTETRPVSGAWGQPGAVRRVYLSDGSTVLETFITERPPGYSTYYFTPESGPARRVVRYVRGEFLFTELPGGRTHVEWRYSVKPRTGLATPHAFLYAFVLKGLLNNAMDAIEAGAEGAANQESPS